MTGQARSRRQTSVESEAGQGSIWVLPGGGADSRDGDVPTPGKGAQRGPKARASSVHLTGRLSQGRLLPVTQYCLTRGRPPHRTVTQGEMTLKIWSQVSQGLVSSKSAARERSSMRTSVITGHQETDGADSLVLVAGFPGAQEPPSQGQPFTRI